MNDQEELAYRFAHQAETRQRILDEYEDCLCWVGHRGCGGCSGVIGITHEPSCGWEWNPDCPVHPPEREVIGEGSKGLTWQASTTRADCQ